MSSLRTRPATADDHPTFARLFLELGVDEAPAPADRFARDMASQTVIVEAEGACVGYAFFQVLEDTGYVRHLVVDPGARRRGVGRFAMDHLARRFREAGCRRWCLNVKPDNTGARALYEAQGMRLSHRAIVIRLQPAAERRLPVASVEARELDLEEARTFEAAFDLPRGLLADVARTGRFVLGTRDDRGRPSGVAAFDPAFPGSFPFRASDLGTARALLDACRERRVPIEDVERLWRADGHQVVTEGDPELAAALIDAGGELVLETLHYVGPL